MTIKHVAASLLLSSAFALAQNSSAPPEKFSGMWLVQDPGSKEERFF